MSRPPVDQAPVVFEPEFADGLAVPGRVLAVVAPDAQIHQRHWHTHAPERA